MVNGRAKGAAGERQAAKWLQDNFNLGERPERNLEQVRSGGYDLIGFYPFAFEIKRCQVVSKRNWWLQIVNAAAQGEIPVVMFRRNQESWKFLISAKNIGLNNGYIQLEEREFTLWARKQI